MTKARFKALLAVVVALSLFVCSVVPAFAETFIYDGPGGTGFSFSSGTKYSWPFFLIVLLIIHLLVGLLLFVLVLGILLLVRNILLFHLLLVFLFRLLLVLFFVLIFR